MELAGELDVATIGAAERALRHAHNSAAEVIVLDLRGLTFFDCSGLRVVLDANRRSSERLLIVRGSRHIQRVFEVCEFADLLTFVDDRSQIDETAARTTTPARGDLGSRPAVSRRAGVTRRAGQAALAAAVRDLRSHRRLRPVR